MPIAIFVYAKIFADTTNLTTSGEVRIYVPGVSTTFYGSTTAAYQSSGILFCNKSGGDINSTYGKSYQIVDSVSATTSFSTNSSDITLSYNCTKNTTGTMTMTGFYTIAWINEI